MAKPERVPWVFVADGLDTIKRAKGNGKYTFDGDRECSLLAAAS